MKTDAFAMLVSWVRPTTKALVMLCSVDMDTLIGRTHSSVARTHGKYPLDTILVT